MSKELTYLEAIREALAEEMRRDPKVFVLGEDVGAYGGAFGATQGLFEEFGEMRVVDTPISESAIVGISIGAALRGYRPVAEMQFADFISCGFDQIVNQAATLRYRYGGRASVPIVVRAPSGGGVSGGLYHSQNPEAWFIHRPGLKVVAPSTAFDAKGLLKAAIRDENPVVYFEHKYLYRRAKGPVPEGDEIVPIGQAATRREGGDATLVTYGAMVAPSLEAADRLSKEGVEVEVIDLRSLLPFDKEAILRSVDKTSRAAHRPRRRQDTRHRRRTGRRHHGGAIRVARCARAARHLPRHPRAVFACARARERAECGHDRRGTAQTGRVLIQSGDQTPYAQARRVAFEKDPVRDWLIRFMSTLSAPRRLLDTLLKVRVRYNPSLRVSSQSDMQHRDDTRTDIAILDRIVARDERAVAELYDRHNRLLYGLVLRILRDRGEAEEVLQEVFVLVWTRAETYNVALGSPAAWLVRIARNRAINRLRSNAVRLRAVEAAPVPVGGGDNPEVRAAESEQQRVVKRALEVLPPEQRILIEQAYYQGLTQSELAERFQLPLGTVKTRIRSGMMALREQLS